MVGTDDIDIIFGMVILVVVVIIIIISIAGEKAHTYTGMN